MTGKALSQAAGDIRGAAGAIPLANEPPAKMVIDAPSPDALAPGLVVIQSRTENLRIVPAYGPCALDVSPRIGRLHVNVDDAPWRWVEASGEPLIIQNLRPGRHRVLTQFADPTHRVIGQGVVEFVVPEKVTSSRFILGEGADLRHFSHVHNGGKI